MWNPFRRKRQNEPEITFGKYEYPEEFAPENSIPENIEMVSAGMPETTDIVEEEFSLIEDNWTYRLRKIIRGLILTAVTLVPIFFLTFTAPVDILAVNKQVLIYGLAFISFILWLVMIIRQGGVVIKRSGFELGVLAIGVAWFLASAFSLQPLQSFLAPTGFITLASLVLFYFLFLNFFDRGDIQKVTDCFLLGAFIAILSGLVNISGLDTFKWLSLISYQGFNVGTDFNTVGSLNTFGALAVLAFILTVSRYFNLLPAPTDGENQADPADSGFISAGRRVLKTAVFIVSILTLLILNWRIFYLAVGIGMLLITFTPGIISKLRGVKIRVRAINIMGPLIILVLALLLLFGGSHMNLEFLADGELVREINLSSKDSFMIAKNVVSEKPIFGFGLENFRLAYDAFRPADMNQTRFWGIRFENPGSELSKLIITGGLILSAGFMVLLFYIFRGIFSGRNANLPVRLASLELRRSGQSGYHFLLILPAFIVSLAIFAFYSFNIVLYFTFWLMVSLLAVAVTREDDGLKVRMNDASMASILSSLAFVMVLAVGLIGSYLLVQKYRSEFYLARAFRLDISNKNELDQAIAFSTKASDISRSDVKYLSSLGQLLSSRINLELNNPTDKREDIALKLQTLTKSAVDTAKRLTEDFGNDSASWLNAASVYQNLVNVVSGSDEAAITAYTEYIRRTPNNPDGYIKLGSIYLNRSERNRLALSDAKSKKLKINNEKEVADLILMGYQKAENNFKKAVELKSDLAGAIYNLGIVYERQNKIKEAIKQLELARAGQFGNPGLAFELGLLYYRDNQKNNAYNEMLRAVTIFNDYSNARWYLALMFEEQGRIELAVAQLKEIVKLDVNKNNQVVLEKIADLEAGQREIPPAKVTSKQPLESKSLQ